MFLGIVCTVNTVELGAMQTALLIASLVAALVGIVLIVGRRRMARFVAEAESLIRAITHGGHNE